MQRLVMPIFRKRHVNTVVILAIKAYSFRLNAVLHKAHFFVKRDGRFVGQVHLQVHPVHAVVEGVLKGGFHDLSA